MKLYGYWRSTAAYRARIALNLKGLDYENIPVHLVKDGGEHRMQDYQSLNPQMLVPTLVTDGNILSQSVAILEYLEERFAEPALLPGDATDRARVRQAVQIIACDIHPLNNLGVLNYLGNTLGTDLAGKTAWYHHWLARHFPALETWAGQLADRGAFFLGDQPGMADICIVPQLYNARRFDFPLEDYPRLVAIEQACLALDAFDLARPENQPDAD